MFLFQYHGILPSKHQNYILPNVSQKRRKYFTKIKGKMVLSLLFLLSYILRNVSNTDWFLDTFGVSRSEVSKWTKAVRSYKT